MHPSRHFHHCPSCGTARETTPELRLVCGACGFTFFLSITCGTAAFLQRPDGHVLFIRREKEPARGKLAIPGGFIDEGETVEQGLRREFTEEVGFAPGDLTFLCSHPNAYLYKDVTYPVIDLYFTARATGEEKPEALDAVAEVLWLDPATVAREDLAFPSLQYAFDHYLRTRPQ
jgi:ADP-ribose pyrophosphatase YjhB (NUDIX family)